MSIYLTEAATEATDAAQLGGWTFGYMAINFAVILGAFWFFVFRPQSKERKRLGAMLANLELGDCVMTTSGFYGIIIDITDDTVIVEFGNNKNCRIPMDKNAISKVEKPESK